MESKEVAPVKNVSEKEKRGSEAAWEVEDQGQTRQGRAASNRQSRRSPAKRLSEKLEELEVATEGRRGATASGAYASG